MGSGSDDELAGLAASQHGVFATHHLVELGFSDAARRARISTGRWEVPYDGVYRIAGAPRTWQSAVLTACWAGGTRALASHRSAAALWDLPSGRTDLIELTCPRWRRTRHRDLVVHESLRFDDSDHALVTAIPCTSVARTLFDLARIVSPVMLDANLDAALRRQLVSIDELVQTAERLATRGRPGGRAFSVAVRTRTRGGATAESVPERLLARLLEQQGLGPPVLQYEVRDDRGRFVARVDLAYPDDGLVVEYDSFEHHVGTSALVRDSARRNAIAAVGLTVLTATAADLRDGADRLALSIRHIRQRAA